jgi:hypothetical protein
MTGPAQQRGFTLEGYKRPPVRVTLTGFPLAPSSCRISSFSSLLLRRQSASDLRQLLVLALPCEVMLLATCLDLILLLSFFLEYLAWASTQGPVMEMALASRRRSDLLVLHQRQISWLLGPFVLFFFFHAS